MLHDFIFTKYGRYSKITIEMRNTLMNENMFANGSVPVKVAARVYGKGNVNEQKRICNERSFTYRVFISGFLR